MDGNYRSNSVYEGERILGGEEVEIVSLSEGIEWRQACFGRYLSR